MRKTFILGLVMILFAALAGCSTLSTQDNASKDAGKAKKAEPIGTYQEFDDVLIPKEMKLNDKDSFVFETPRFKTGVLIYSGRVDHVSLANFFETNMANDNWKLRSKMKYGRTILVFEKPDRDCIINIIDQAFKTILEVYLAPRYDTQAGAMSTEPPPVEENLAQ